MIYPPIDKIEGGRFYVIGRKIPMAQHSQQAEGGAYHGLYVNESCCHDVPFSGQCQALRGNLQQFPVPYVSSRYKNPLSSLLRLSSCRSIYRGENDTPGRQGARNTMERWSSNAPSGPGLCHVRPG